MPVTPLILKNQFDEANKEQLDLMKGKKLFKDNYREMCEYILTHQAEVAASNGEKELDYQTVVSMCEEEGDIYFVSWVPSKTSKEGVASKGYWKQTSDAVIRRSLLRARRSWAEALVRVNFLDFGKFRSVYDVNDVAFIPAMQELFALFNFDFDNHDIALVQVCIKGTRKSPDMADYKWGLEGTIMDKKQLKSRIDKLSSLYESAWIVKNFLPFSRPNYKAKDTTAQDLEWVGIGGMLSFPTGKKKGSNIDAAIDALE